MNVRVHIKEKRTKNSNGVGPNDTDFYRIRHLYKKGVANIYVYVTEANFPFEGIF